MDRERWLPVSGIPEGLSGSYEVSSMGRVRSLARVVPGRWGKQKVSAKMLRTPPNPDGYPRVGLNHKGHRQWFTVHRLIALAFIGEPPSPGMEACHENGKRSDNRLSNIRWDTRKGNASDMFLHGTNPRGERHGRSKLTPADVIQIRRATDTHVKIAQRHGISRTHVGAIRSGKKWGHLG